MRVRNKELKKRWARKEQRIKELIKEAKAIGGATKKVKAEPKPKKVAEVKGKAEKVEKADKPKKAPAKKKEVTEEVVAEVAEATEAPAE